MKSLSNVLAAAVLLLCAYLSLRIYCPMLWVKASHLASYDTEHPFTIDGTSLTWEGETFELNPCSLFVNPRLSRRECRLFSHVYASVEEALRDLPSGTEEHPSCLFLAPGVYWIDDPDDPAVRLPENGGTPYGLVVSQSWITFKGLSLDPRNVVLACNRGQTQGAEGNFTMFRFNGDGIRCENLTMGNYCNIDLEYPLCPSLGREKRMPTITQAQLATCHSDKVSAVNCRFVSRLNACPFTGAKRAFFQDCHFECTNDALCASAVYYRCDVDFYAGAPFWSTKGTGAAFIDCDIRIRHHGVQAFAKVGSQVNLIDTRFHSDNPEQRIDWTPYLSTSLRSYQYGVTLNGQDFVLNTTEFPEMTVTMEGKPLREAYRIETASGVVYNLYGLTRGHDGWDPAGQRELLCQVGDSLGRDLTSIPVQLSLKASAKSLETGTDPMTVSATALRFYGEEVPTDVRWVLQDPYGVLRLRTEGATCQLTARNFYEIPQRCVLKASTPDGLQAAMEIEVRPQTLPAPAVLTPPALSYDGQGGLRLSYRLALDGHADQSEITWYRCRSLDDAEPLPIAVSRHGQPLRTYRLKVEDRGAYIRAELRPKSLRSGLAEAVSCTFAEPIRSDMVTQEEYSVQTDFLDFPTRRQPRIEPGAWTVDAFKPLDTDHYDWKAGEGDAWYYGTAADGARGEGLVQAQRGARLLYTPLEGEYGDMEVYLRVDPCKAAGQGFGSATGQYLDVLAKFDTRQLTGYALRIERTIKHGSAVDFVLMEYHNGETKAVSEPVSSPCFRSSCHIYLYTRNDSLFADVHTDANLTPRDLPLEVHLSAPIRPTTAGGSGVQHTGTLGSGAAMLHDMTIRWK